MGKALDVIILTDGNILQSELSNNFKKVLSKKRITKQL